MSLLIENASQVVTCRLNRGKFKSGKEMSDIGLLTNVSIYSNDGLIQWIGKKLPQSILKKNLKKIDGKNKVILPGFVDSHTHSVFAGDRSNEYSLRIQGKTYEEIAAAGGGIVNTMTATRKTSKKELIKLTLKRLKKSLEFGVTTIEIKSGYGLDTKNEIKMLEVIKELKKITPIEIYATFLGAHAFPKDNNREDYIVKILNEMIPMIAKQELATFIDVFCEKNYYTPEDTERIFKQGIKFGLIPKLHTNQFYSIGGIKTAINNKAISVDHLEVMTNDEINNLKDKNIIACLLPTVSYFLDIPYAHARELIENNIPLALATDFNPGSSMTQNIQLVMSMAVHKLKMNIEETINAVTINGAAALNISDKKGSIGIGKQADMIIFDVPNYKHIFYNFGVNNLKIIIINGKIVKI